MINLLEWFLQKKTGVEIIYSYARIITLKQISIVCLKVIAKE